MRRVLAVGFQFVVLLVVLFVGSVLPSLPVGVPMWKVAVAPGHWFVLDGVFFAVLVYLLLLLLAAARGRWRRGWVNSTTALALALVAGWLLRVGFLATA